MDSHQLTTRPSLHWRYPQPSALDAEQTPPTALRRLRRRRTLLHGLMSFAPSAPAIHHRHPLVSRTAAAAASIASVALFFDPGLRPPVFFPRIFLPSILEDLSPPSRTKFEHRHGPLRRVPLVWAGKGHSSCARRVAISTAVPVWSKIFKSMTLTSSPGLSGGGAMTTAR
jgi:hypothetical protein